MGQSARLENARNFSGILNEFRAYCGEIGDIFIAPRHFKISSAEDTGERSRVDDAQGFSQRRVIKRGAWAGEVGQTQFMPSSLILNSWSISTAAARRDLVHSVPDVLASTANSLQSYGWQRGGAWTPGSANFAVNKEWNKADVYARTIAYFATRLAGGE